MENATKPAKKPRIDLWEGKEKPTLRRSYGINDVIAKQYKTFEFTDHWLAMFNKPEQNFKMLIYGPEKNGKTKFTLNLVKYLSRFRRVLYNNHEEGIGKTFQAALISENMKEVSGRVMIVAKESIEETMYRLSMPYSPAIIVFDSIDYCGMTDADYKLLTDTYPKKSFILIAWTDKDDITVKSKEGQKIKKRVDITVHVKNFTATPVSRFADTENGIGNTAYTFGTPRKSTSPAQSQLF